MGTEQRKPSSVRHTRAIQYARTKHKVDPPPPEEVVQWMEELVQPATFSLMQAYHAMGLRSRILDLPVMVALMISMIWRQVGSACELVRLLAEEGLLWVESTEVSQQAVSERMRTFPAVLFERVLVELLPRMEERAAARSRPLPASVERAQQHFRRLLIVDGSTLDVLLRKVGLLEGAPEGTLAGKLAVMLDLSWRLPVAAWLNESPQTHDLAFREELLGALETGDLVVLDRGYVNHSFFDDLTDRGVSFITRAKNNTVVREEKVLRRTAVVHDRVVALGSASAPCRHLMRRRQEITCAIRPTLHPAMRPASPRP